MTYTPDDDSADGTPYLTLGTHTLTAKHYQGWYMFYVDAYILSRPLPSLQILNGLDQISVPAPMSLYVSDILPIQSWAAELRYNGEHWQLTLHAEQSLLQWRGDINLLHAIPSIMRELNRLPDALDGNHDSEVSSPHLTFTITFEIPSGALLGDYIYQKCTETAAVLLRHEARALSTTPRTLFDGLLAISRTEGLSIDYGRMLDAWRLLAARERPVDWKAILLSLFLPIGLGLSAAFTAAIDKLIEMAF